MDLYILFFLGHGEMTTSATFKVRCGDAGWAAVVGQVYVCVHLLGENGAGWHSFVVLEFMAHQWIIKDKQSSLFAQSKFTRFI